MHLVRTGRTLAVCAVFLLAACAVNPATGKRELMLVSEQQEIAIGLEASPSLNWSYGGPFDDPELHTYLEGIVRRVWDVSERKHLPLTFQVQNTSIPNAFALPGYVAMTRGLLAELESEAQFVAVMGHEVGHVTARHTAKRMTQMTLQQVGLAAGGLVLQDEDYGNLILTAGALSSSLLLLKYSRDQELQADGLGIRYMTRLGYDPQEALRAHERLETAVDHYMERLGVEQAPDGSLLDVVLSTHPRHEVRMDEMREIITTLPARARAADKVGRDIFREKTAHVRRVHEAFAPYDRAERLAAEGKQREAEKALGEALALDRGQPAFHTLGGMLKLQEKDFAGADKVFARALALDAEYQPALFGRGAALYYRDECQEALPLFERSLESYPADPGSQLGLGACAFRLKQYEKAIPPLRSFAQAVPRHSQVHGLLGLSYEGTGDIRAAIQEYRAQVQIAPDTVLGRRAQDRLNVLTGGR